MSIINECYQNGNYQQINAESGLTCVERKSTWGMTIINRNRHKTEVITK